MILIDANLLIYAHVNNLPQHFAAKGWLDECLNASAPVGLPWPSLLGFLRIVTNPRIFERPESIKDAWKQVKEWLECPSAWIPQPAERHVEILEGLIVDLNIAQPTWCRMHTWQPWLLSMGSFYAQPTAILGDSPT